MPCEIKETKNRIIFSGELTLMEIEPVTQFLKEKMDLFYEWESISILLENLEKIDSAGIQLLLSLKKTYGDKLRFSNVPLYLKTLFSRHGFKFAKINS